MFEEALEIWSVFGVTEAVEYLNGQEPLVETAETYHKLMKELYWKEKKVPDMMLVAQFGMDYCLSNAKTINDSDPGMAYVLRSWAKSIAYDLASFTWRGWDEVGIVLSAEDEALGLGAAELNLRLAIELDKGAMRISRAHWMLGAQQMAAGKLADAEDSFLSGVSQAAEAEAKADESLCYAYAASVKCLQQPEDPVLQRKLNEAKDALEGIEHGHAFVEQIETAERVFG